jgi:hypothetical protein
MSDLRSAISAALGATEGPSMKNKFRLTPISRSSATSRGQIVLASIGSPKQTVYLKGVGHGGSDYLCGKCGTVLIENVLKVPFINTALRCNACDVLNNPSKLAKFEKAPTMLDEVESLTKPIERYIAVERVRPCPQDSVLDRLHQEFVTEWSAAQGDRPHKLYHYTSLDGLKGILSTHQIWVTDVAYLNDSLELQLASSLIERCTADAAEDASDPCKELLRRSQVGGSQADVGQGYYVACFCDDRDLLSQWRAYGAQGGGYALGFSAYEMAYEGLVALRRVVYDPVEQEQLVRGVIARTCAAFDLVAAGRTTAQLDADHTFPSFAQLLASHFKEFLVTFKHDTFSAEKEWRIFLPFSQDQHLGFVRFRGARGQAVPYMALHPRTPSPAMPLLPIVEVIHGPSLHPDLTKKSLNLLLQSTDYDHVEVGGSRSPLRV